MGGGTPGNPNQDKQRVRLVSPIFTRSGTHSIQAVYILKKLWALFPKLQWNIKSLGCFLTFEMVEFVTYMGSTAHGFTHFCVHAFTEAKELFPLYRATSPDLQSLKQRKSQCLGLFSFRSKTPGMSCALPEAVPWGNPKHLRAPVTTELTLSRRKTLEINGCTWKRRVWRTDEIKQVTALQKPLLFVRESLVETAPEFYWKQLLVSLCKNTSHAHLLMPVPYP